MNYKRIILGGLVAGIIINVSEFVLNGVVLREAAEAEMARLNLAYAGWAMPMYVVMAFVWGIFLAWLYAALRPRFGAGPATAIIAAAVLWTVGYVFPSISVLAMGLGTGSMYAIALAWGAVEVILAALAAGALYRETEAAEPHRVAAH